MSQYNTPPSLVELKENIQEHIESLKIENDGIWNVIDITTN